MLSLYFSGEHRQRRKGLQKWRMGTAESSWQQRNQNGNSSRPILTPLSKIKFEDRCLPLLYCRLKKNLCIRRLSLLPDFCQGKGGRMSYWTCTSKQVISRRIFRCLCSVTSSNFLAVAKFPVHSSMDRSRTAPTTSVNVSSSTRDWRKTTRTFEKRSNIKGVYIRCRVGFLWLNSEGSDLTGPICPELLPRWAS